MTLLWIKVIRRIPLGAHELITTDPSRCTWTDHDGSLWVHMNWLWQIPLGAHELITTDPSRCTWTDHDGSLSVHMNWLRRNPLGTHELITVLLSSNFSNDRNCSCIDDQNKFTNPELQLYWWQEQVYKPGTAAVLMTRTSLQTKYYVGKKMAQVFRPMTGCLDYHIILLICLVYGA